MTRDHACQGTIARRDFIRMGVAGAGAALLPGALSFAAEEGEGKTDVWVLHGTDKKMPDWPSSEKPIPQFTYQAPAGTEYLRMIVLDAGLLAGAMLVFFMLSFVSFLRYDVR